MKRIEFSPDEFVPRLLSRSREIGLCLLDSCGKDHPDSHLLIAGIAPVETHEITNAKPDEILTALNKLATGDRAAIFTLSYDFGRKLQKISRIFSDYSVEPDLFVSMFDGLLIHDYVSEETFLAGNTDRFENFLNIADESEPFSESPLTDDVLQIRSNFSKANYLETIGIIKERIRRGDTYQANLTQQLTVNIPAELSAGKIFERLRNDNPAPFAAFIERSNSTVISASPERFFSVEQDIITTSPIKGTRPRGKSIAEDRSLREELVNSAKDRAENTMIVDLSRNDLGRVCEYGSVEVTELCTLQELPTLFHLVSTIRGHLRTDAKPSDIIRMLFPCGSITGAPKLATMKIIDELEKSRRGLSMGAIGVYIPGNQFGLAPVFQLNVAIRTMVIRNGIAQFNVGGGITIDSEPEKEYGESLDKAKALIRSISNKGLDVLIG